MIALLGFVLAVLAASFKSKSWLEAENAVLRHQLIILQRKMQGRVRLTDHDRWFFVQLYRWFPSILTVLAIIKPETLVRWHRAGFRCYWRWKSGTRGGRPQIDTDLRTLIGRLPVVSVVMVLSFRHLSPPQWRPRCRSQAEAFKGCCHKLAAGHPEEARSCTNCRRGSERL